MRFVPMDNRNLNFLYGYALSREAEKLVDAYNPKKLIRTVFKFAAKRLAFYTDDQLSAAVDYCLFGADWTAGARGPDREQGLGNREQTDPQYLIPSHPQSACSSGRGRCVCRSPWTTRSG